METRLPQTQHPLTSRSVVASLTLSRRSLSAGVVALSLAAACASVPTEAPKQVEDLRAQFADADLLAMLRELAPGLLGASEEERDKAVEACAKGDTEDCAQHAEMSKLLFDSAIEKQQLIQAKADAPALKVEPASQPASSPEAAALTEQKALFDDALAIVGSDDAKITHRGLVITARGLFATGKAAVLPEKKALVDSLGALAGKYAAYPIVVEGHTDNRGASKLNQTISQRRADSVMMALKEAGVSESRLSSQGMGEDKPISDNSTNSGRAINRRVEIVFGFGK